MEIKNKIYSGERSLFATSDASIEGCVFKDGESPLKESKNLKLNKCTFEWKYPLWYCKNVYIKESTLKETARSGIWYIDGIQMDGCNIEAPKTFRKGKHIVINASKMPNAKETLWGCEDIHVHTTYINGDYFAYNSVDVEVDNVTIDGNYAFDSCKNVTVRNSILNSKDAFWNCENVTIINCRIIGEYIGWNTKNITIINSHIESHQGLCYIKGLKMRNCTLEKSDLTFEYCEEIDAQINSVVDSIKNPTSGYIFVRGVKQLIMDKWYIDPKKTLIVIQ